MKRFFVLAVMVFSLTLLAQSAMAGGFAVINLNRALNMSEAGGKARLVFDEEFKKLEQDKMTQIGLLKKMDDEIREKKDVWNPEFTATKIRELQAKEQEVRKKYVESLEAHENKKREKEKKFFKELLAVVDEIVKEKGYDYVFEVAAGGVLIFPDNASITDEVIKRYNKQYKD